MKRQTKFITIAAALFVLLTGLEQWRSGEPFEIWHLMGDVLQMALLAAAVAMTAMTSAETRDFRLERLELIEDLAAARRESGKWRVAAATHVEGLSRAIAGQFAAWALTGSEADVAGLMLKGLSHREIASLRQCSEVTVRQHATTVYRKSGLSSRAQLTAFFLEDLLPEGAAPSAETAALRVV